MPTAFSTVITIGIKHHNSFTATLTTPLNFKLLNLLKDVLFQFYHLLFCLQKRWFRNLLYFSFTFFFTEFKKIKTLFIDVESRASI